MKLKPNEGAMIIKSTDNVSGYKYRLILLLGRKITAEELLPYTDLEGEKWALKPDRFDEVMGAFFNWTIDIGVELWEMKEIPCPNNEIEVYLIKELMKDSKIPPIRYLICLLADEKIDIESVEHSIEDAYLEHFKVWAFAKITRIKYLPKEVSVKTIKFPLDIIKKLVKDHKNCKA